MTEEENAATNGAVPTETAATPTTEAAPTEAAIPAEEITYHAVEKDGKVSALWEMQGRKHLRTIHPDSRQGQEILRLYSSDHHEPETTAS